MATNRLIEEWRMAADDLSLTIIAPFTLGIAPGIKIDIDVLLRNFGGVNGMAIIKDSRRITPFQDRIVRMGYGYSTLSEPRANCRYDRDVIIGVLRDWGWTGPEAKQPGWL